MANGTKEHYVILDGLRGVAALMVVGYHLFEAVAFAAGDPIQKMFHGFLAVDFFLILSGFVMGYAYDSRWDRMSVGAFFKRRLIRLHPMVVIGVIIGLIVFVCQGCMKWDGTRASTTSVLLTVLLSLFMIPSSAKLDVRGNTELFPLNGPHWSLFFEYIGSIFYALLLRRLSDKALKIWVACAALALLAIGIWGPDGSIAYGWSSKPVNMLGGLFRMTFNYPMGLLLARMFAKREKPTLGHSAWGFIGCAAVLILLLCVPPLGAFRVWFEVLCVVVFFPAIIWAGAYFKIPEGTGKKCLSFLGDLSYPLYAVHYPFIYAYIGWIGKDVHPFGTWMWATPLAVMTISIATAVLCMKLYDQPLRRYLTNRFVK